MVLSKAITGSYFWKFLPIIEIKMFFEQNKENKYKKNKLKKNCVAYQDSTKKNLTPTPVNPMS